jgi:acetyltransferase-like isoleucine patch superfamily enzyme
MDIPRNQYDALAQHGFYLTPETDSIKVVELLYESPIRLWENSSLYGRSSIGAYSYINKNFCAANIQIGRFCSMASYIREVGNHDMSGISTHPAFSDRSNFFFPGDPIFNRAIAARAGAAPEATARTSIGNDVWIGEGVLFKAGVTIGNGAIIGANSFVREDVPPYAVVVGCPARISRMRFPDKVIERLQKMQWWNYDVADLAHLAAEDDIEKTCDLIEEGIAKATIKPLQPDIWLLHRPNGGGISLAKLTSPNGQT